MTHLHHFGILFNVIFSSNRTSLCFNVFGKFLFIECWNWGSVLSGSHFYGLEVFGKNLVELCIPFHNNVFATRAFLLHEFFSSKIIILCIKMIIYNEMPWQLLYKSFRLNYTYYSTHLYPLK